MAKKMRTGLCCLGVALATVVLMELLSAFLRVQDQFRLDAGISGFLGQLRHYMNLSRMPLTFLGIALALLAGMVWKREGESLPGFFFRMRYAVAGVLLLLLVAFGISGSSFDLWRGYFPETWSVERPLLGIARNVRSDEALVETPLAIAQGYAGYPYISDILRADSTDAFTALNLPVLHPLALFRPFTWGYLLLGISRGLSFFFFGQFFVLFLVTIEFILLLTRGDKRLACLGAVMICFSSFIQWWASLEMLIFGQLSIVLLGKYIRSASFGKRTLLVFGMFFCLGCFFFTFYPAWMVPFFYIFLAAAAAVLWEDRAELRFSRRDVGMIILAAAMLAGAVLWYLRLSFDTLALVRDSKYPGTRFETGGGSAWPLFQYAAGLFFPYFDAGLPGNTCEFAEFWSFYPLGLALAIWAMGSRRRVDPFLLAFLGVEALLTWFAVVGFPAWLARITLLSNTPSARVTQMIGYLHLVVLLRALCLLRKPLRLWAAASLAVGVTAISLYACGRVFPDYMRGFMVVGLAILMLPCVFLMARYANRYCARVLTPLLCGMMVVNGALVNPLQPGLSGLEALPLYQAVSAQQETAPGTWIVDGAFPLTNFPVMAGAPTLSSTQTYANPQRWKRVDRQGVYEDITNRFAHISVSIKEQEPPEKFVLLQADWFVFCPVMADLQTLGVDYILTCRDLSTLSGPLGELEEIYPPDADGSRIYRIAWRASQTP